MSETANAEINAGYEVGARQVRVWVGNVELRLENQWAELLEPRRGRPLDLDLLRAGGAWDELAARLDLRAGVLGFQLSLTGRFGGSRGEQRVRRAAADARAVLDRLRS